MRLLKIFLITLFLVACTTGAPVRPTLEPLPAGDAMRGKSLFDRPVLGSNGAPGCTTCHSLTPGVRLVGPSLDHVSTRATVLLNSTIYKSVAKTNVEYLQESIIRPDAYVVEGFVAGSMYQKFSTDLTPQQIADLIAYLLTLQ